MRHLRVLLLFCSAQLAFGAPLDEFIAASKSNHGALGEKAAHFLVAHMPSKDQAALSAQFLIENLDLAFKARDEFPWGRQVPEELFLNDVLPYVVFDEPRHPWRAEFYAKAGKLVRGARTATEAVQTLNRQLFNLVNVHYNTGRKRPNQSPKESMELGMATCTGLAIILVDACRAVGIPARAIGTPLWANERGNHTWVEVWDGDWHFTGADEYDKAGLNRGWFVNDAAQAKADVPRHAIYATSWKKEGLFFPMVWARRDEDVAAVNVTARYAIAKAATPSGQIAQIGIRLFESKGGKRLVAKVRAVDQTGLVLGEAETKAGKADLNDMPRLGLQPGTQGWLRFTVGARTREIPFGPLTAGDSAVDAVWGELVAVSKTTTAVEAWLALPFSKRKVEAPAMRARLTKAEAHRAKQLLAADRLARLAVERKEEMDAKSITYQGKTLRWLSKTFGEAPKDGRSLWISMHGGGNAPAAVNDKQWKNQIDLYTPTEGIYVAPRAPTDTWNLWHEGHIDTLFQRLIDNHVALLGVNPNKIYLMGYSAGGDGVWQLAPRMADRFAAAAMMAGHPNEASLLGLRNLPFAIFMGGNDTAYNRNKIAKDRSAELDQLEKDNAGGYVHMSRIYEGLGHWMNRKDAEALPWMAQFRRTPWPKQIVWRQDDIVHHRFYWLQAPEDTVLKERQTIKAKVDGQTIRLEGDVPTTLQLQLSDELIDLDRTFSVVVDGHQVFSGKAKRRATDILRSLEDRPDPASAASAIVTVSRK